MLIKEKQILNAILLAMGTLLAKAKGKATCYDKVS